MKNIGIFLFIFIFVFLSGCGVMGGPTNVGLPRPTNTPMRWYAPIITPTPLTAVPSVTAPAQIPVSGDSLPPTLSVTVATNCRKGPSADYDILLAFFPGQTAAILGKFAPTNYWVIQTMNGYTCWLWGQNATVTGNIALVPDFPVPALPTPTYTTKPINSSSFAGIPTPANTLIPTPVPTLTPPPPEPQQTPPPPEPQSSPPPPKQQKLPPGNPFKRHGPGGNGGFIPTLILV